MSVEQQASNKYQPFSAKRSVLPPEIDSWMRRAQAAQTPRQLLLNSGFDDSTQVPPTFGTYSIFENYDLTLHGVVVHAAQFLPSQSVIFNKEVT